MMGVSFCRLAVSVANPNDLRSVGVQKGIHPNLLAALACLMQRVQRCSREQLSKPKREREGPEVDAGQLAG